MKRSIILMIAVAMMFASCGSDDGDAEPASVTTAASPRTTIPAATTVMAATEPATTDAATTTIVPSTTSVTTTTAAPMESATTTAPPSVFDYLVADDVAYAPVSDLQRLDIYMPSRGGAPLPVVVIIHGGGWTVGDKRGELPLAAIPGFLAMGFAVASVNYRLAPDAVFPAQLLDVKAAVRHLRSTAAEVGLDPDRIAVVGESAGGHLAALLGTTQGLSEFDDPALGNPQASSAVQAVVDLYGTADLTTSDAQRAMNPPCPAEPDPNITLLLGAAAAEAPELATAASPVSYLQPGKDLPPFFIAHGDADCVVPHQQSVELHNAIEAMAPGRSQLTIVPGSGHYLEFDFASIEQGLTVFLDESIGPVASS